MRTLPNHFSGYILPSPEAHDIVHYLNGIPITESSKQTQSLVGATFVQPVVMDYQGSKAIIFVFAVCNLPRGRRSFWLTPLN